MAKPDLTPEDLRQQYAEAIAKADTFKTLGVSEKNALDFLETPEGRSYQFQLATADRNASADQIRDRAVDQLNTGRELPRMEIIDEPLAKIVPQGTKMTAYSPYMTKLSHIENAVAAGQDLFDRFSLFARALS